jgi:hypothetical protein
MILPRPLTTQERTTYQARLDAARLAYDELMVGGAVKRTVDQNGEQVEFTRGTAGQLAAYITALENALSPVLASYRQPKPMGFTF